MMEPEFTRFNWTPCPKGQAVADRLVETFLETSPRTRELKNAMKARSGTRFFDWIDYLFVPDDAALRHELEDAGFLGNDGVWEHPGALFPRICLGVDRKIVLKVESLADFLACHGVRTSVSGIPFGQFRLARAWDDVWVVERHGFRGFSDSETSPELAIRAQAFLESFRCRQRNFKGDNPLAFRTIHGLLEPAIEALGRDWTCDLFFSAERDYWMRRNRAGRVQKARQDALGLGWANHDHHTYRCRRQTFHEVIAVFEKLGFTCRERFYAGAQAGWGAQIVEQGATGITIFADVDMAPEEVAGDFAHEGFSASHKGLGTVGLWCELHGESILEAGMHHLEAQFDFDRLSEQILEESGISMMKPFTNFAYLRQQFTEGENWPVSESRIRHLLDSGDITKEQAESFRENGAVGSHLENLERNDGFKGFNQTGISDIISRTDARRLAETN